MSKNKKKKSKEPEKPLIPEEPKGICGLINLGNSCYLNSILQCLLHIPELLTYMNSSKLNDDLSLNKKLNQDLDPEFQKKQELCYKLINEFHQLLTQIWSGYLEISEQKCIINPKNILSPYEFKKILSEISSTFEGYTQQDAHEVLTTILEAFHLTLNKKPNVGGFKITASSFDSNLALRNTLSCLEDASHRAVNDSIIEDLFFGQFSSIYTCCKCHIKLNEKYDPFSSLELPIPIEKDINLYVLPLNIGEEKNKEQIKLNMNINDNMSYDDIYDQANKVLGYNFDNYVIYWKNTIRKMNLKNRRHKTINNYLYDEYNNDDVFINVVNSDKCQNFMNFKNDELIIMENPKFEDHKEYEYNIHLHIVNNKYHYYQENIDRIFKVFMELNEEEHLIYNCIYNYLESFVDKKNKKDKITNNFHFKKQPNKKKNQKIKNDKINDNDNNNNIINLIEEDESESANATPKKYILGILCKKNTKSDSNNNYSNIENMEYPSCPLCKKKPKKRAFEENYECFCINDLFTPELKLKNDESKKLLSSQIINFIENTKSHSSQNIISILIHPYTQFSSHNLNKISNYTINSNITDKKIVQTDKHLLDLLDIYTSDEKIDYAYNCPNCGLIKRSYQKKDIHKFPQVLIIHLKRFKNEKEKNEETIDFPEKIDLSKYNNKGIEGKYELNSAVFHQGNLESGHYTSIYKYSPTKQWLFCNDTRIKILNGKGNKAMGLNNSKDNVSIGDAYILFYRKI